MTPPTITKLPKSRVEIKLNVSPDEAKPYLDQAVIDITEQRPLKGFRPGKATYQDVRREYGEMAIWEAALERIVRALFVKTILEEKLQTIGSPEVQVDKLAPNENVECTIKVSVLPSVEKLGDSAKTQIKKKSHKITDAELEHAIEDLRKMRRVETVVDRAATKSDIVSIDLEILKDLVTIEGGISHNYKVALDEAHYIPGFADKLVGAKKGDELSFELNFPEDHYQKMLAGKPATFKVKVNDVIQLDLPPADDEFAKNLGLESFVALRDLLKKNMQEESDQKTREAAEVEMLEKLVAASAFGEMPDLLVTQEVQRMLHELEHSIEDQGMRMEDYLSSIKKSKDQLTLDFVPRAIERIKTALIIRAYAEQENIAVDESAVEAEIDRIIEALKPEDKEGKERVSSPEYRDYVAAQMKNRQVLEILAKRCIVEA